MKLRTRMNLYWVTTVVMMAAVVGYFYKEQWGSMALSLLSTLFIGEEAIRLANQYVAEKRKQIDEIAK